MYRYETHCHSSQCSRCAHSSSQELVYAYHRAGFSGLVLTDHFIHGYTCVDAGLPWQARMQAYYNAYLEAKQAAQALDFDVIFGIEHAYGCGQEILCYGIGLDFLLDNPDIPELPLEPFVQRLHQYGGIAIQAHPYRYGGWEIPLRMDLIDGIEIFNAGNSPDKNEMAMKVAQQHPGIRTSGGDIHWAADPKLGTAGICLPYRVHSADGFVRALKQGDHELICSQL